MRILASCFLGGALLLSELAFLPAWSQDRETVVAKPNGDNVTVRTDESGTTVIATPAAGSATPISPADQVHDDKVFELTKDGGRILSETSGK